MTNEKKMDAGDCGFVSGLQDAILLMKKERNYADRMMGCHYTAMNSASTVKGMRKNRSHYEWYKGKRDAFEDALAMLNQQLKEINAEYES